MWEKWEKYERSWYMWISEKCKKGRYVKKCQKKWDVQKKWELCDRVMWAKKVTGIWIGRGNVRCLG